MVSEVSGTVSSDADLFGAGFLHLGMGLESVLPISGLAAADEDLLSPVKGEALESTGGLNAQYTALAIEGMNSGSEKTAGSWWLRFSRKSAS